MAIDQKPQAATEHQQQPELRTGIRCDHSASPDKVAIEANGTTYEGMMVNQSFGGLGLVFDEIVPWVKEEVVEFKHKEIRTVAVVRHVSPFSQGGCMVGLQWQSSALASRANQLRASMNEGEIEVNQDLAQFIELLPGGITMMWRFFEHEMWIDLGESIQRLRRQASIGGIANLKAPLMELEEALLGNPSRDAVQPVLTAAIDRCIERTYRAVFPGSTDAWINVRMSR